jgi:arabinogalactan oligomer/maltooligosaccharide transport system substrate-binding protein
LGKSLRKEGLKQGKRKKLLIGVLILLGIGFILAFAVMWTTVDQKTLVPSVSGSPTQIERAEIIVSQSPTKTTEGEDQSTLTPGISQDSTYSEISGELKPKIEGDITLWHAYQSGSTDESILSALIENAEEHFPDLSVNVLQIPASEIVRDYQIEVIAGEGPDLFLAPNIGLGNWARDGLVLPLDPYIEGRLEGVSQKAIEVMVVDESIYGIPESTVVVALYYNKSLLESPPRNTEELLQLVQDGKIIANVLSAYYLFGWSGGFGGRLLDDDGKCIAEQEGWVEAMQYLVDLKQAGGIFEPNYETAEAFFLREDAAMFVNGPWSYPKYKRSLGDNLGVVVLPSGPAGPATPLIGADGFYINPNSHNVEAALELALYLTNQESSQSFAEFAGHVPARLDVTSSDLHIDTFMEASAFGYPVPQSEQFANYWSPFEEMFFNVLSGEITSQQGVSEACAKMDAANEW